MVIRNNFMSLQNIANSGQCFRWSKKEDGSWKIPFQSYAVIASQREDQIYLSCSEEEFDKIWKQYFDFETDYQKLLEEGISFQDEFLTKALKFGQGMRILRQDFWEVLVSFLISQNNNIERIKKIIQNLCVEEQFPTPEQILKMDLSKKGLGYRERYISAAASWWLFDKKRPFTEIKGVGPKVEACVRLYGLHEMQYCPMDTWMKKIVNENYGGKEPEWMKSDYAGFYQQVCFYYKRMSQTRKCDRI